MSEARLRRRWFVLRVRGSRRLRVKELGEAMTMTKAKAPSLHRALVMAITYPLEEIQDR